MRKPTLTDVILAEIGEERARQDRLKSEGKFKYTCADDIHNETRLAVLAEEVGEVARAVCELMPATRANLPLGTTHLREELIQVAAVCLAWVEGLDS